MTRLLVLWFGWLVAAALPSHAIAQSLAITGTPAAATVGDSGAFAPTIAGGVPPYSLSVSKGVLPPGRAISGLAVTGTYATAGSYAYTLRASDVRGARATLPIALTVAPLPLAPTSVAIPSGAKEGAFIAAVTGLSGGDTIATITPDDGRITTNGLRNALLVGGSPQQGNFTATIVTSFGRVLPLAVTASGGTVALPQVTYSSNLFVAGAHQGTTLAALGNVPVGAVLSFSPADGRIAIAGDAINGFRLVAGPTPATAGPIAGTISGAGISPTPIAITVAAAVPQSATGYSFTCNRCRTPDAVGAVAAGNEFRLDVSTFYSAPWGANSFRIALPGHYVSTVAPLGEAAAPSTIHIDGVTLWYRSGTSTWNQAPNPVTYLGATSWDVAPGAGVLTDDTSFSAQVPAGSFMQVRIASHVDAGGSMIVSFAPNIIAGGIEGANCGSSSFASGLTVSTKPSGAVCTIQGQIYSPAFIVAKPTNATVYAGHHSVLETGDSKTYAKNMDENWPTQPFLANSFAAMAFDDATNSSRWGYNIMATPSNGAVTYMPLATASQYRFTLLHKVPNRPYDIIIDDAYNNDLAAHPTDYRTFLSSYYGALLAESQYWGNAPAPLYKFRIIPRSGSWSVNLADQAPNTESLAQGVRWQLDADLVSGYFTELTGSISTNTYYAYDQGSNRDKVAVPTNTYTLASNYAASATTADFTTQPNVGERLVFDPTSQQGSAYVRTVTGSGPYTVTMSAGVAKALTAGTVVPTTYVGDAIGLHPSNEGHKLIAKDVILNWKALISGGYDLPAFANDNGVERKAA